jgi:predicted NAD/FAD-dependent oxidoreductase
MPTPRIAVIGAGLAAVACASRLQHEFRIPAVLFEKSRGRGGRCATKRTTDGLLVDHGAQYFTIRDPLFSSTVHQACGDALLSITAPITAPDGTPIPGEPRWYHRDGNSRLARDLGPDLDVRSATEISRCEPLDHSWLVNGERFDAVVSTAPLPQSYRILGLSDAPPQYVPCLTLILSLHGPPTGRAASDYAVRDRSGPLEWSACENHKLTRIASDRTVFVSQASEAFSREFLEADPAIWAAALTDLTVRTWNVNPADIIDRFTHRWRYARIASPATLPPLPHGTFFAGDATSASRVESAWLGGRETAARVAAFLTKAQAADPAPAIP